MSKKESFQLKADFVPMTVFKLSSPDLKVFSDQLVKVVNQAPNYFVHAPVVLDVQAIAAPDEIDFAGLCEQLKTQKILPVGIKGLPDHLHRQALQHGMAIMKAAAPDIETNTEPEKHYRKTKVITTPVRSGTQIYAEDADLIVMAAVNSGAEVIADGHIHIYGPLRGRALAGAQGDESARIFCQRLEAGLVSVAGCYQVKEKIVVPAGDFSMYQIYLEHQRLKIEGI